MRCLCLAGECDLGEDAFLAASAGIPNYWALDGSTRQSPEEGTVLLFPSCGGGLIGSLFHIVLGKQGSYGISCNGVTHLKQVLISIMCYCHNPAPIGQTFFFFKSQTLGIR